MRERFQSWWWCLLLTGVIGLFFHECLSPRYSLIPTDLLHKMVLPYAGGTTNIEVQNHYTFDALTADYPYAVVFEKFIHAGEWPLWNPLVLGGHPYLAANMQAALNPFRLLVLLFSPERSLTVAYILEFLLAGLFMFAFLREIGRSRPAAFLGGCAFALNSAFVLWYWRVPSTFCWAPLILLLYERSVRRNSWNYRLGTAAILGVAFLSGNMQASAHLAFLCGIYALGMAEWSNRQARVRTLAGIAIIFTLAFLLSALLWLPSFELMREGAARALNKTRIVQPGIKSTLFGIPLLITFIFPALAGSPETFDIMKAAHASLSDFYGYVGIVPFTAACVAVFFARERRVRVLLAAVAGVLFIVFFTPLLTYLYHRFFIVIIFAEAVMAAYGFDAMLNATPAERTRIARLWKWALIGGVLMVLFLGAAQTVVGILREPLVERAQQYVLRNSASTVFANQQDWLLSRVPKFFDHYRLANPMFWVPLAALFIAGFGYFRFAVGRMSRTVFIGMLVVCTVGDLTVVGRQWLPVCDLQKYPVHPPLALLKEPMNDPDLFRVHQWVFGKWWIMPNSLLSTYGLASIGANESLWGESLDSIPSNTRTNVNHLLDLQNVKYLITDTNATLSTTHFELIASEGGVALYRNLTCLPRIWMAAEWEVIPQRSAILDRLQSPTFDARRSVILEQSPNPLPERNPGGTVTIVHYGDQQVAASVACDRPALVMLADTFYPGWKAFIDKSPVPIYRADYVFRAVVVPAGQHELEFRYEPQSFQTGKTISAASLTIVLIGFGWFSVRTRRLSFRQKKC